MPFSFKNWFFRQLPEFYQATDTYQDANGEGILQRYLKVVGLELDQEIMPYIDNMMDVLDPETAPDKYLPLIANILGMPPSLGDNNSYRKVLLYALAIYKVKGTVRSYEIFFNLMGLNIRIIEEIPKKKVTYDDPITYDDGQVYDTECDYCSGYWIAVSNITNTTNPYSYTPVDQAVLDKAQNIICFLQPINAKFLGFIQGVSLTDTADLNPTDSTIID